jgi:hypothetical protein
MVYVKSYQKGNVSITVWDNVTKPVEGKVANHFPTFSVQKSYKSATGEWVNNATFTEDELLKLSVLIGDVTARTIKERGSTDEKEEKFDERLF